MISFHGIKFPVSVPKQSSTADMMQLFGLLKPKPSPKQLRRIGGNRDGSYLLPDDFNGISACFSPGVNNFKFFEDVMVEQYGIDCHMCDFSSDVDKLSTPIIEGRQTFLRKWLSPDEGPDNIELGTWIAEKAPEGDLLLQIDIEGAEYQNILSASVETLERFRIIVMEVHALGAMRDAATLSNVLMPFFQKLSDIFAPVHAHPNNCCGEFTIPGTDVRVPNVLEMTFLRKDRVTSADYLPLLPHPDDISRNDTSKPLMFLGEEWSDAGRPLESKVKVLEEMLALQSGSVIEGIVARQDLLAGTIATLQRRVSIGVPQETPRALDRELAEGQPFVLSSVYPGGKTTGSVTASAPFFFHTNMGFRQSIKIDLGRVFTVSQIKIANRTDRLRERARLLFCILEEDESGATADVFELSTGSGFETGVDLEATVDLPRTPARYVTIISPLWTALHFSDLKVFGQ